MDTKILITEIIEKALRELDITDVVVEIEQPKDTDHGDFSSNVALIVGKVLKRSPRELAKEIVKNIEDGISNVEFLDKVEIAGPGFINFWVSNEVLFKNIQQITEKKDEYGKSDVLKSKRVMVEFTDPNPFKEFHIGHLYSNTVGESLSRLFEANGANVKRANYQGDVGLHVAKALYGLQQKLKNSGFTIHEWEKKDLKERAKFLGEAYALGANAYEENEEAKKEIAELNKKVFEKDSSIQELYEKGRQWTLDYFEEIYKRLGTKFDFYYFESVAGPIGLQLVLENLKKGIFEESEGAVIFPGKKYGLHNRVFINSLGLPTYEAKELGLAPTKYKDFAYDTSIIVTGNEINEYFRVLLKALSLISPDLAAKTTHISHGMVRLPSGKMSSRTGNVVTGESMLDEAKKKAEEIAKNIEYRTENKEKSKDDVSEVIGVGAVKYALLKNGIGKDVKFDFDEVVSFEGNSGPYLQYTYVRTHSILEKAKAKTYEFSARTKLEKEEAEVVRHLLHFQDVIKRAAGEYSPNLIATYLYELAQKFNLFYEKHQIIESKHADFRLALTEATGQVLKNGLYLLGIKMVERM